MSDITITFAIVVGIVVLFVSNRIPVVLVALGTALALYFTGVTNLSQSLSGLGDPAVIFVASLFVVSAGLEAAGVTAWVGQANRLRRTPPALHPSRYRSAPRPYDCESAFSGPVPRRN